MASKKGSGNAAPTQNEQKKPTAQAEKKNETVQNETEQQPIPKMKDPEEPMFTLTTQDLHGVADNDMIRKLMPIECWRLQGFTDEQFNKARAAGLSDARLQTFLKLFVNSLPMIL